MFLDVLIFMLLGILVGTLTGLMPGIHPNTVFVCMISMIALMGSAPTILLLVFIMALAVSNTFVDFLPSIIFGAPDPSTALSVLPGHKLLLEGRGHEAIMLTVMGGLGVAVLTFLTMPLLIHIIPQVYPVIRPVLHILLIFVVVWMIATEKDWRGRVSAMVVFLLSGMFGVVSLNAFASGTMLFPSLTGLFALSTLLVSFYTRSVIPHQDRTTEIPGDHRKGILIGWVAGWFAGMLPGVGAAQAGVLAAQSLRASTREFITALGGINTSNIMFTFIMFYVIGRTRSGAVWAISQLVDSITLWDMALMMLVGITTCFVSAIVTIGIARVLLNQIRRINYSTMSLAVMVLLVFMVLVLSGPWGMLAVLTGTFMGLLSILFRVKRSHLMGYLILPTILYFSGLSPMLMASVGI